MCNGQGPRRPRFVARGIAKSGMIWDAKKCTIVRVKACAKKAQKLNLNANPKSGHVAPKFGN